MDMSNNQYIALLMQHPEVANNPKFKNYLQNNPSGIKWNNTAVQEYSNPLFKNYQDTNDEIKRIYGEQIDAGQKEASSASGYAQNDYQSTIDQLNQGLQSSASALSNKEGIDGTWGSSARAERLNSLNNQYNNKFTSAYDTASRKADTEGMRNQKLLGYQSTNPMFQKYNTQGATGQSYKYNPFQQAVGGIEAEKNYSLRQI